LKDQEQLEDKTTYLFCFFDPIIKKLMMLSLSNFFFALAEANDSSSLLKLSIGQDFLNCAQNVGRFFVSHIQSFSDFRPITSHFCANNFGEKPLLRKNIVEPI
jgi:hypothetical protein